MREWSPGPLGCFEIVLSGIWSPALVLKLEDFVPCLFRVFLFSFTTTCSLRSDHLHCDSLHQE